MNLNALVALFHRAGSIKLYAKVLATNDNSKNQVYFGKDFTALTLFPNKGVAPDGDSSKPRYKASLDFSWLSESGDVSHAPYAQLILYPQYPEVRFSGFLRDCSSGPSELYNRRLGTRILFLGVTADERILGYTAAGDSDLAGEFLALGQIPDLGVFAELPLPAAPANARTLLLAELCRIHRKGWIDSKRLNRHGNLVNCPSSNCGGYTLEAELGIIPNGNSEPDYLGYEVKQYSVPNLEKPTSARITLMTPEPTGGFYRNEGVEAFIRRFGYEDLKEREDRINFGGVHKVGIRHNRTGLTLALVGYENHKVIDPLGRVALFDDEGVETASWGFAGLMKHWSHKHAHAVYVPSIKRVEPPLAYQYGSRVRLAQQPDFLWFLEAFAVGAIFYDPGLKLENASGQGKKVKARSQFRISSNFLESIYTKMETVEVCG